MNVVHREGVAIVCMVTTVIYAICEFGSEILALNKMLHVVAFTRLFHLIIYARVTGFWI